VRLYPFPLPVSAKALRPFLTCASSLRAFSENLFFLPLLFLCQRVFALSSTLVFSSKCRSAAMSLPRSSSFSSPSDAVFVAACFPSTCSRFFEPWAVSGLWSTCTGLAGLRRPRVAPNFCHSVLLPRRHSCTHLESHYVFLRFPRTSRTKPLFADCHFWLPSPSPSSRPLFPELFNSFNSLPSAHLRINAESSIPLPPRFSRLFGNLPVP